MKTSNNIIALIATTCLIGGCAYSKVGGGKYSEHGKETVSFDECMGHCISKSEDGMHCVEFSGGMASICDNYLHKTK